MKKTLNTQVKIKEKEELRTQNETEVKTLREQLETLQQDLAQIEKQKKLRDWFLAIAAGLAATFVVVVTTVTSKH